MANAAFSGREKIEIVWSMRAREIKPGLLFHDEVELGLDVVFQISVVARLDAKAEGLFTLRWTMLGTVLGASDLQLTELGIVGFE